MSPDPRQQHRNLAAWTCCILFVATMGQLVAALLFPNLPQFGSKAFGARAILYPLVMLTLPVGHWLTHDHHVSHRVWTASALVMLPFFVDMTGNSLDMYNRISWWDDACHFANWAFLLSGIGLLIDPRRQAPRPVRMLAIAGLGAILAILWELGEWFTFMRFGTELQGAYTDTLGDLALGTLGATLAAVVVTRRPAP